MVIIGLGIYFSISKLLYFDSFLCQSIPVLDCNLTEVKNCLLSFSSLFEQERTCQNQLLLIMCHCMLNDLLLCYRHVF